MKYFEKKHPITSFIYLVVLLALVTCTGHDYVIVLMLAYMSLWELYKDGIRRYIRLIMVYVVIIFAFGIFNLMFVHTGKTVFLYINDKPLTVEALMYGLFSGCFVCILLLWFRMFQLLINQRKIIYLFGRWFPAVSLIISMCLCFYDKFKYKMEMITQVWNDMENAGNNAHANKVGLIKHFGTIFSVLLTVMLEDSVITAQSMRTRGYGKAKRTCYNSYSFSISDVAVLIAAAIAVMSCFVVDESSLSGIVIRVSYIFIPLIYNIGKELQWKYYLSGI